MPRVLIADDDKGISDILADVLEEEGIESVVVNNGDDALSIALSDKNLSLIILDIMMPGQSGLEVCKRIRDRVACPILFVTAKNRMLDTLLGLEIGGDDYITKPFVVEEIVARVKAHIRRDKRGSRTDKKVLRIGDIALFKDRYEVTLKGIPVALSTREFQLFCYLCENEGLVLSKEQIFDAVWGKDYGDIGTVAVHIKNLRDKLDSDSCHIKTVWGAGYKLVVSEEAR